MPFPGKRYLRAIQRIGRSTWHEYQADRCELLAAATAFYGLLSLAPLLLLLLSIASWFVGEPAAQRGLLEQVTRSAGSSSGAVVERLLRESQFWHPGAGVGLLGLGLSLYGATRLFVQLQTALNHVWGVHVLPSAQLKTALWLVARRRAVSYLLVVCVGLLFTASLGASACLNALRGPLLNLVEPLHWFWQWIDPALSLILGTAVFALIFKIIPDVTVRWQDVWAGAAVTSLLFNLGKSALAWYLGYRALPLTDGLATPLVVLILWAHYSSRVFFIGAEFTQIWAQYRGAAIVPSSYATSSINPAP